MGLVPMLQPPGMGGLLFPGGQATLLRKAETSYGPCSRMGKVIILNHTWFYGKATPHVTLYPKDLKIDIIVLTSPMSGTFVKYTYLRTRPLQLEWLKHCSYNLEPLPFPLREFHRL